MGQSTDAILFYGYCWTEETSRPWEIGEEDPGDNDDEWEDRYALAKGLAPPTEPFPQGNRSASNRWQNVFTEKEQVIIDEYKSYWDAKRKICEPSMCAVNTHCSNDCPMPYVAIVKSETLASRGSPEQITSLNIDPLWDSALIDFCKILGIDVSGMKPAWWLVSDWS